MPAINTRSSDKQIVVDLEPLGRRVLLEEGATLLDAFRQAGVEINAVCSGNGACRVRLIEGALAPHTPSETDLLAPRERQAGVRLACQASRPGTCPQGELRGIDHLRGVYGSLHPSAAPVNKQAT